MAPFSLPASSALPLPEWYEIYIAAVFENDEHRAQVQLGRVAKVMAERIVQLRPAAANHAQELADLGCALTYVRLRHAKGVPASSNSPRQIVKG